MDGHLSAAVRSAATTRDVRIAAGNLGAVPAVLRQTAPAERYVVVADDHTWKVAGKRVASLLASERLAACDPVMLTGEPRVKPSAETARALAATIKSGAALPIAVGAGVINDLVKYAAELAGMPYVCVPTAASMDGYAASGAALRDDGFKRTFACSAPVAIVADLDVIATAPAAMAGWGYGDLVGKLVAGADWIMADALGVEALNPSPFAMVQNNLAAWLGEPAGVRRGERGALDGLMRGLIMAGLAMQAHGNSRPASGSDHQFAHLWEMEEVAVGGMPVSHGACVGIGCLSMLAAYEWLLRQDLSRIAPAELAARRRRRRRCAPRSRRRSRCRSWRPTPRSRRWPRRPARRSSRRACAACRRAGRESPAGFSRACPLRRPCGAGSRPRARRRARRPSAFPPSSTPRTTSAPG